MDGNASVKEAVGVLGDDLRERILRTAEPVKKGFAQFWDDTVSLTKKHPGMALSLAAVGGAVAGILVTRMVTPIQSDAEQKVRHWVHNAQGSWGRLQEGLDQALTSVKSAISLLKQ
jgi:ElaB/YqjD/DUF883 family membrane-anchored ribosome-binding protein